MHIPNYHPQEYTYNNWCNWIAWAFQADGNLTLVNSEHSETVGDMYI